MNTFLIVLYQTYFGAFIFNTRFSRVANVGKAF